MKIVEYEKFRDELGFSNDILNNQLPFIYQLKVYFGETYECGCGAKHVLDDTKCTLLWHSKPELLVGRVANLIVRNLISDCSYVNYLKDVGKLVVKYETQLSAKIPNSLDTKDRELFRWLHSK